MINVFTIATDVYIKYIPTLKKSLCNFMPEGEQIRFILIADTQCVDCDIYYHICNLPYPFNTYHKIDYIIDCIKTFNIDRSEYFVYVDADTCFRKMSDDFWNTTFKNIMSTNKLCFTRSPWKFHDFLDNENINSSIHCKECYINTNDYKRHNWVQTSFFMGPISKLMGDFFNKWIEIITNCTKQHRITPVIPYIFDQSVINKIISIDYNKYIIDDFIFNAYAVDFVNNEDYLITDFSDKNLKTCDNRYELNKFSNIFLFQKFNTDIKESKRL